RAAASQKARGKSGGEERDRRKDAGSAFASSLISRARPAQLPRPLTGLIGREQEVREIQARLIAARLVTLTGTGGVGKTRLAIEVAGEAAEEYADGACFVDLTSITEPSLVPQAVAAALGLQEATPVVPGPGGLRHLITSSSHHLIIDFLRPRQLLLVLDN